MLWKQLQELLMLLSQEEYRTASALAEQLKVSEKTVRLRLKDLSGLLEGHGAEISSKARYGYILRIHDQEKFDAYIKKERDNTEHFPEREHERREYLLAYLISRMDYIKIDELCDFLFVSKSTLSNSLKTVEGILKRYGLSIERKPNYGIRIQGKEFDIRRLLSDYFIKRQGLTGVDISHQESEMIHLAEVIKGLLKKYGIRLSEIAFENFVEYTYVARKRMKSGFYLQLDKENLPEIGGKESALIRELVSSIGTQEQIVYTADEEHYLLLYLAGKRMIGSTLENDINFVIREQTDQLALAMMELVSREYGLEMHNNFEIRMTLNQHLVPFDIRIRYDIPLKNPILEDIKQRYCLAYQISYEAVGVLKKHYKKDISEAEIGYFALIFQLALEKDKMDPCSDILVVCSTGKGSSRLLKYKYESEFSGYLRNIYVCDLLELEHFDFQKVDYIFSTVPIPMEVPVPIVEVGAFLEADDIQKITKTLRRGNSRGIIKRYYTPQRLLTGMEGKHKEDILKDLCGVIKKQEKVDGNFYELVLERETFAQMDYGNYITLPHPNQIASEETFAYVAILKEPVIWNKLPVQIVLLISIGRKEDRNRQTFYETTARFALNKEAVKRLIQKPEYETLLGLLEE